MIQTAKNHGAKTNTTDRVAFAEVIQPTQNCINKVVQSYEKNLAESMPVNESLASMTCAIRDFTNQLDILGELVQFLGEEVFGLNTYQTPVESV